MFKIYFKNARLMFIAIISNFIILNITQANSINGSSAGGVFYVGDTISIQTSDNFSHNAATVLSENYPTIQHGELRNQNFTITFTHTPPDPNCEIDPDTGEEICDDPEPQKPDVNISVTIFNADQNLSGGVFSGMSGKINATAAPNTAFIKGDSLTYTPPANSGEVEFSVNLTPFGLGWVNAEEAISLPDDIDVNPNDNSNSIEIKATMNGGDNFYSFNLDNIVIDTSPPILADDTDLLEGYGVFSGNTGFTNKVIKVDDVLYEIPSFKIGDPLTYTLPEISSDDDGETFSINLLPIELDEKTSITTPTPFNTPVVLTAALVEDEEDPKTPEEEAAEAAEEAAEAANPCNADCSNPEAGDPVEVEPEPTPEEIEEKAASLVRTAPVDFDEQRFILTITDQHGNETIVETNPISIDLVRPIFLDTALEAPFLSFDHDRKYKGITTEISIRTPKDATGDITSFSADFSDIGLPNAYDGYNSGETDNCNIYQGKTGETKFLLREHSDMDNEAYTKDLKFYDNAGNTPIAGEDFIKTTKPFYIDLIRPVFEVPLTLLTIFNGESPAKINDIIKVIRPVDSTGDKPPSMTETPESQITYSIDLTEIGGSSAVFSKVNEDKTFAVTPGALNNEAFSKELTMFDKALNTQIGTSNEIIVDNKPPEFNFNCGGAITVLNFDRSGEANDIADFSNGDPDVIQFSIDNSLDECDFNAFKANLSTVNPAMLDRTVFPTNGQVLSIPVGPGSIDSLDYSLVFTIIDAAGNEKDFASGLFKIDNEIIQPGQFSLYEEGHPSTPDGEHLDKDTITVIFRTIISDIVGVSVHNSEIIDETILAKNERENEQSLTELFFQNDLVIKAGNLIKKFKKVTYQITDDAGNIVDYEGLSDFFITNDTKVIRGGGGGVVNLNRQDVFNPRPNKEPARSTIINSIQSSDKRVFDYLNTKYPNAEDLGNKLKNLRKHGFDLGKEELQALREASLKRRLNYLRPSTPSRIKAIPSGLDVQRSAFLLSRQKIMDKDGKHKFLEKELIHKLSNGNSFTERNLKKNLETQGGLRIQNSLAKLKFNSAPKKERGLRKSYLNNRGKFGFIK